MALLQQAETLSPEAYQQQTAEMLVQNLPLLLKGNPTISIAPLSWKNAKGESAFTLNLDLLDPSKAGAAAESPDQQLARSVKKIDAQLTIPVAMAQETMAQAAQLQGASAQQAQQQAEQQVKSLAAMGEMFKITTLKDNVISSSFKYADNQIELNGSKMSLRSSWVCSGCWAALPHQKKIVLQSPISRMPLRHLSSQLCKGNKKPSRARRYLALYF
ncbi:Bacterial protein of uncharacterised function (DUF945) [Serratia fonticola]|uniref:Bacterial protein of uncharacterized function (DUF945) n=1 Tax=Serratia fonticola TaxID=47917 RepID=A0A4U9WD99_SERFO|nr:Bacterial protein of uncharacterised function (DUF945) [Serratia fonticola]